MSPLERVGPILKSMRRSLLLAAALVLVAVVAYVDYRTGWETSLAPFYLLPISLVAWVGSRGTAAAFAIFCGATWYLMDRLSGHVYSKPTFMYWDAAMQLGFFLFVAAVVSQLKRSYARERATARVDPLTNIANRRAFEEMAMLEMRRAARYRRPFTLAYLDVDDFKTVNDRWGHAEGDRLLRLVADVIRRNIRIIDQSARIGGDEFLLLLPETGGEEARVVFEKLVTDLRVSTGDWPEAVTLSAGVVTFVRIPPSLREAIEKADGLMYEVKKRGKNGVDFLVVGAEEGTSI